jgi:predicted aspartyl protease
MIATARTVRRFWRTVAVAGMALGARDARAQISVSGSPAQMKVSAAVAGAAPTAISNASTTYTLASSPPSGHFAITASINSPMPAGVTLKITLAASRGTSAGAVTLSTVAQNVVTAVTRNMSSQVITYNLSATAAAGVVPLQTRTVTLTQINTP